MHMSAYRYTIYLFRIYEITERCSSVFNQLIQMLTILVKNHFEQLSYYLSTPFKVEIKLKQKKIIRRDNKKPEWRTENFVGANRFQVCPLHTE